jgi:hypothetical protein
MLALTGVLVLMTNVAKADQEAVLRATLSGPALPTPIVIHGADIFTLTTSLGVVPAAGTQTISPPAPGDLGPAFRLSYYLRLLNGRAFRVHQTVYPYAVGRPWAHIPPGQRFWDNQFGGAYSVRSGWWNSPATDEALKLLQAHGLPSPPQRHPATSNEVWLSFFVSALVVLFAGAVVRIRRRTDRGHSGS